MVKRGRVRPWIGIKMYCISIEEAVPEIPLTCRVRRNRRVPSTAMVKNTICLNIEASAVGTVCRIEKHVCDCMSTAALQAVTLF
jgi:hypothetical protein